MTTACLVSSGRELFTCLLASGVVAVATFLSRHEGLPK